MTLTWQILFIGAVRVGGSLPVLRWPLAGGILALVVDFSDLFLMDVLGGVSDYQRFDKICDLVYMLAFLAVALRWDGVERAIAVVLFAIRIVGDVLFELSSTRELLFLFPNLFEFWFLFVAARHRFMPRRPLAMRSAAVALVALLVAKEAQEYTLHVAKALDAYVATDVVRSWWPALSGAR